MAVGIVKSLPVCFDAVMSQPSTGPTLYKGYRFPPAIISYCVWLETTRTLRLDELRP
jgi:hypothetical protein